MRVVLSGHGDVDFVGYSIPHPSEAVMNLRLQTLTQDTNEVLNEGFKTLQVVSKTIK
jgi:DNA-directed RNA polymerase I and III subunit RPAC2